MATGVRTGFSTCARSLPGGWFRIRGGGGSGASARCGLTSRVGRGAGRCWWTLALFWSGRRWSVGLGCGLRGVAGRRASRPGCSALRHEGGGGGVGDGGGAPCWALLLPGLGWLGLEFVDDVLGGSGSCCRRGAGLRFCCKLRLWCADRVSVSAWRRSWVSAGLQARASLGRGPLRRRGFLRSGLV